MHSFPPQDDNKFKTKAKTTSTANSGINSDFDHSSGNTTTNEACNAPIPICIIQFKAWGGGGGWAEGVGGGQYGERKKRQIYSHSNRLSYSVPGDLGQSRPDSLIISSEKCRHSHNLK